MFSLRHSNRGRQRHRKRMCSKTNCFYKAKAVYLGYCGYHNPLKQTRIRVSKSIHRPVDDKTDADKHTTDHVPEGKPVPIPLTVGECSICMDDIQDVNGINLACGHIFHKTCMSKWGKNCPLCREEGREISTKDFKTWDPSVFYLSAMTESVQ
jgi:hypothetical protein